MNASFIHRTCTPCTPGAESNDNELYEKPLRVQLPSHTGARFIPLEKVLTETKAGKEDTLQQPDIPNLDDTKDLITSIISAHDDPTMSPWTVRAFIIGGGLAAFSAVLAEIYYWRPQSVLVSVLFLAVVSYVIRIAFETFIPTHGWFRYLNPGPFNKKENAFIVIMASATANAALGTEVLAVQRLYYDTQPDLSSSLFIIFSSQLVGFGLGGSLRPILLYPTKMLYPDTLPLVTMMDTFECNGTTARKKMRLFYIGFIGMFIWEIIPQWISPLLGGFSIFCLANQRSSNFTRIFGGTNGNEGLGFLSFCLDWQYLSGGVNPLAIPLQAQVSNIIGYLLSVAAITIAYYCNFWKAQNFPFLATQLFYENGTIYDQTLILNNKQEVDPILLAEQGLPWFPGAWIIYLFSTNLGTAATFTHLLLWNFGDLSSAWSWLAPSSLCAMWKEANWRFWRSSNNRNEKFEKTDLDPHYREMLKYPDAPNWWYMMTLMASCITSLVVIYQTKSTLPWWGFVISVTLSALSILFFGALYALTGLTVVIQPVVQMIGSFLFGGRPLANMYFVLFSYNSVTQAELLLRDLKIAQYTKVPHRAAFVAQLTGTILGSILNYVLMNSIIDSQRDLLLATEGTNIWTGWQAQQSNSQAIAWGGLGKQLFGKGQRYELVTWAYLIGLAIPIPFWVLHRYFPRLRLNYLYVPLICYYMGWLASGVNSVICSYFAIGVFSQWYVRKRYPTWFVKYNYILGAAFDGGAQMMVFILSFAVQGAAGRAHLFPKWWGANHDGHYDRCAVIN